MLKENLQNWVKGQIELSWVKDGIWVPFHKQSNLIAYGSADICASAVAGLRQINGMYIGFENDSGAVEYTPGAANDAAYYATEETDRSFVRVTTLGEPIIETSDEDFYAGNKITFLGVTDGTTFFPATPLTDSTSVLYHSALISIADSGDQIDDLVFSNADFSTPVTKVAGAQLGVRWELTFTKP
jgi:hypothetical protein